MLATLLVQFGISAVAAGVVAAAIQFLSKAFIEDRFKRALEALKSDLEILRNRVSKLHDQEFVVLPEVWSKMAAALGTIIAASDPHRLYPSTKGMHEGELNEYLETAPLLAWEKGNIKNFPGDKQQERDATLQNMLDWAGYRQARLLTDEFRTFLRSRRIFMSDALVHELDRCCERVDSAVSEFRKFLEARQAGKPIELVICPKLKEESTRMVDAVRMEIQKKLLAGATK